MPRFPWQKALETPEQLDLAPFLADTDRIQTAEEASRLVHPPDDRMNQLVSAVAERLRMPIALINFVYGESTDPMAQIGLDFESYSYMPKDSICTYVAAAGSAMVFDSPQTAPLLASCLNVGAQGEGITYYAGQPIRFQGRVVGVLAVADTSARRHNSRRVLADLRFYARSVEAELRERSASIS